MRYLSILPTIVAAAVSSFTMMSARQANAQWEFVYGQASTVESGGRGVQALQTCANAGFVSVGSTSVDIDVHVVRTDAFGTPVFERRYDIGGEDTYDYGQSIVELRDGSGFVITGYTTFGADRRNVFLLKIDCDGDFVWASVFGDDLNEVGFDVVEATSGNPLAGTAQGDLIVAGLHDNPNNRPDGLILRADREGNLIWAQRYDLNDGQEIFWGLLQSEFSATGGPTGDIVAVGRHRSTAGGQDAFVVRVDGDNGLFLAVPHCAATYGDSGLEEFNAVVELDVPILNGMLAYAGSTQASTGSPKDIYVAQSEVSPCLPIQQRRLGNPGGDPFGDEFATDIIELRNQLPFAPRGSLLITGGAGRAGTQAFDAFLLAVQPTLLLEIAGSGRLYGDHADGYEVGLSLNEVGRTAFSGGVVIAGTSRSDFEGIGDPSDSYLLRTNFNGATGCEIPFAPQQFAAPFPVEMQTVNPVMVLQSEPVDDVLINEEGTAFSVCP